MELFLTWVSFFEDFLWIYVGFPLLILLGAFFSIKTKAIQIRKFPFVIKTFFSLLMKRNQKCEGVHPIRAFFACVGGCIGVGNIVAICTAAQIGGPGALLWIWITALLGMLLKYSEVFLGIKYRVTNEKGGYNGGPMFYLKKVFKTSWVPSLVCVLLCIYGVEIYQFNIITASIVTNIGINKYVVIFVILGLVIFAGAGGVQRVGSISSAIIPVFLIMYMSMGLWVMFHHLDAIPGVLKEVFTSAFSGHAAVGGFAGSTVMMSISQGIRRGCYTGDVGVGYASVIHSETSVQKPSQQACLAIFDIFLDTFIICTTSVMLILVTGIWKEPMHESLLIQTVLSQYFPYMHIFMPFFLFLLGYSTIIAYFCVGMKCAEFLSPKRGKLLFYGYAVVALLIFSFVDSKQAIALMGLTQALLLLINVYGMFRLRKEIDFNFDEEVSSQESVVSSQNAEVRIQ